MTKGAVLESLDPSHFARSRNPRGLVTEKQREVALLEAQVYRYAELLGVRRCGVRSVIWVDGVWCMECGLVYGVRSVLWVDGVGVWCEEWIGCGVRSVMWVDGV